ncbi:MAG TPA: CarD family transcriptional regulator [Firmicutes bacterium]|nr:CarD family transcriptional regulator [Bacillota bacterium]
MFKVGDKVVYPMHGAGVIEAIEEHEVLGQKQEYYIMRLPFGDMKVMIPVRSADQVGLRSVVSSERMDAVILSLHQPVPAATGNWNHRYRANLEKIKSSDIFEVAGVVQSLTYRDREKGLSTGERRMLEVAKQILVSEIVLSKGIGIEQASTLLARALA